MNITCVLPADSHYRLPHGGRWRLHCVQGSVWVTQAGDGRDHVLQAGDEQMFEAGTDLLIGALRDTQLQLEWLAPLPLQALPAWQARFFLLLQRWWRQPSGLSPTRFAKVQRVSTQESCGMSESLCEERN